MLALAPLAPHAAPLDAGERFALDLLLDCSCVLRADARLDADVVRLRIVSGGISPRRDVETLATGTDWLQVRDGEIALRREALALVRDIAGAVAEQRSTARDRYDRVPSAENLLVAVGHGIERVPVVSRFAGSIAAAMRSAAGRRPALFLSPWPGGKRWAAALSHDLDVVSWWPAFTALRLAELARKGEVAQTLTVLRAVLASGGREVVWRGVREVLQAEAAHGVRSSWFILCGTPTFATARAGDLTYSPETALAQRILAAIVDAHHELGLHGSFATSDDPTLFTSQRERLAALTGATVRAVRQHYLRMRPSVTPAAMSTHGFAIDSTWGFADRNGFRLGVADVVPLWDAGAGTVLDLEEAPFCWMDRALSKYRGIEQPDAWIDDALALADECRAVQGMFVGIWHPNLTPALGYPAAPAAYARLVSSLIDRGAYVAPIGELVDWRRLRRSARATAVDAAGRVRVRGASSNGVTIEDATGAHVDVDD